jgi:hypothetical protein
MSDESVNVIDDDFHADLPHSYGSAQKMSDVGYVGISGSTVVECVITDCRKESEKKSDVTVIQATDPLMQGWKGISFASGYRRGPVAPTRFLPVWHSESLLHVATPGWSRGRFHYSLHCVGPGLCCRRQTATRPTR